MSFFRSSSVSRTEAVMAEFKQNVKKKIVDSIKDMQVEYSDKSQMTFVVSNNELSNQLICGLEALFIHGMKGSFIGKLSSAVFGGGVASGASDPSSNAIAAGPSSSSKLPEPNFWMFVLVFSHRDTIKSIEKLAQVNTDIGRGRSWLRLALNDGLLGAYLQAMQKDKTTSQKFYHQYAILRDPELLDVITRYICGIEHFKFDIALNSAMLNRWQTAPLILAGLWTPSVVPSAPQQTVQMGMEAAEALEEEGFDPLAPSSSMTSSTQLPTSVPAGMQYLSRGLLNEDEALKLILQGRSYGSGSSSAASSPVGTPKTSGIAVRVINKNGVKKPVTSASSKPPLPTTGKRPATLPAKDLPQESSNISTIAETENSIFDVAPVTSTAANVTPPHGSTAAAETSPVSNQTVDSAMVDDGDASSSSTDDSDVEESIYSKHRRSLQEDTESYVDSLAGGGYVTAESTPSKTHPDTDSRTEVVPMAGSSLTDVMSLTEDSAERVTCTKLPESNDNNLISSILNNNEASSSPSRRHQMRQKSTSTSTSTSSRDSCNSSFFHNLAVPHLAGFIESWNPFGSGRFFDTPPNSADIGGRFGFSLRPEVRVGALNEAVSQAMMHLFDQVVREKGLDAQNYACADCSKAIGTLFGPAKVCSYTKLYYCDECHVDELSVIPAKIVYGWNFQQFKVSKKAKIFLNSITIEPIIDVQTFNAALFQFSPDLNEVFTLRKQLKYMNAYLMTCNASGSKTKESFTKLLWPRSYLFEDVGKYSVHDLEEIRSGKLKSVLNHATRLCRDHILNCILCQGKGFICEVCRDPRPVYPFELDRITQCPKCFTVFHASCSIALHQCPKCDRIEARNLNWQITEARLSRLQLHEDAVVECT